jgi:hypothetical protein
MWPCMRSIFEAQCPRGRQGFLVIARFSKRRAAATGRDREHRRHVIMSVEFGSRCKHVVWTDRIERARSSAAAREAGRKSPSTLHSRDRGSHATRFDKRQIITLLFVRCLRMRCWRPGVLLCRTLLLQDRTQAALEENVNKFVRLHRIRCVTAKLRVLRGGESELVLICCSSPGSR